MFFMKRNSVLEKYNRICKIYFEWLTNSEKSQSTLELYPNVLNMFGEHLQCYNFSVFYGNNPKADTVLSWKQSLIVQNFKQSTIRTYLTVLRLFFDWAVQNEYYLQSPVNEMDIPVNLKQDHSILSDDEIKTLLYEKPNSIRKNNYLERNRAIVVIILQCGLKVSEIVDLKYKDLDLKNSLIHISSRNSINKPCSVILYPVSKQCLKEYLTRLMPIRQIKELDYLFGQYDDKKSKQFTRQNITKIIKSYIELSIGRIDINSDDLLWTHKNSLLLQHDRQIYAVQTTNSVFDKITQSVNTENMSEYKTNSTQNYVSQKRKVSSGLQENEMLEINGRPVSAHIRHGKQLTIAEYAYSADEILSNPEIFAEDFKDFDKESKNIRMNKIDSFDGYEFQDFIADLFQKMGYEASVNNKAYDWGVDIIVKNEFFSLGIQCKLSKKEPIDNEAVQEIVAGIRHYKLDKGMVITNNYFHKSTQQLAKENNVLLWDRDDLYKKVIEFNDLSGECNE